MGSCFADSIGTRLVANKVETRVNPFGTVFQPLALARLLRAAAGEDVDWQRHLVQARGRWQSYDLHGSVGADSPVELLQYIQEVVRQTGDFLRTADVVMLTLGTAWAYRLRETGELVSNCHKQPADLFVRELLTPDEIINALAETHAFLRRINPDLRFVLTVSPVRHLKDTLQLNAVSKSVLRLATHIVSDLLPGVAYFPAYELLVDDLRDYRFYASDMLHPSEVAEDYIWEKFARAYFDADFGRFRKEWAAVRQSLSHRPLHEGAPEHRQFLESTREKLEQLSLRKVDVADELRTVQTRLAALPEPRQPEPVVELEDDEERIDIGEYAAVSTVTRVIPPDSEVADAADATLAATLGQSAAAPARTPRLSPEEFRAQRAARPERGRRDGRGKGQRESQTENEQFQTAALSGEPVAAPTLVPAAAAEALAAIEAGLEAQLEPTPAITGAEMATAPEPAKKKKRRSRGGAKRTARKHALRLAAEMGLPEDQQPASGTALEGAPALEAEAPAARPETQKSSVIVKSQPVKRGGRRNEAGRVPRVALFAAPPGEAVAEPQPADAELPTPPAIVPVAATPAVALPEATGSETASEPTAASSRNSRNRKKKKSANAGLSENSAEIGASALPSPTVSDLPLATAAQLSGPASPTPEPVRADTRREALPVAALPRDGQAATAVAAENPATTTAKPARRNKSRAISGARAEKPAVDTPVVPVPDPAAVRTQVAAGRLMGSSASLVEPGVPAAKMAPKAAAKQEPTAKASAKKKAAVKAEAAAAPLLPVAPAVAAAEPKARAASKTKASTQPKAPASPAEPAQAEPKPTAKAAVKKAAKAPAKAALPAAASAPAEAARPVAKASTRKPAAKPAIDEPAAAAPPAKVKTPKAAATKTTPAKPKSPRKSAS
ncbi:hypothetical protein GCM10027345_12980 [Hymenobacter daeguensis]